MFEKCVRNITIPKLIKNNESSNNVLKSTLFM